MSKYFKHKQTVLLLVGFGWMGTVMGWMGPEVVLTRLILFEQSSSAELLIFLQGGFMPFNVLAWVAGVSKIVMINQKRRKQMILIGTVIVVIVFPLFTYVVFTNPELIGVYEENPVQVESTTIGLIYAFAIIFVFIMAGFWLSYKSMKSDNPETILQGKLLTISFILFCSDILLILLVPIPVIFILAVGLAVPTAILFYAGFMLSNWAKKLFLKER